jgi:hypothetical protein
MSGFRLDKLAPALRGMPRGAPILIELPDGRLAEIASIRPTQARAREAVIEGGASAQRATYAIVRVAASA